MTMKERVHHLVDALPESETHAVERYLEFLRETTDEHPLLRTLRNAPEDDEPYTDEERAAVAEARADIAAGRVYSHEQIKRELGLA